MARLIAATTRHIALVCSALAMLAQPPATFAASSAAKGPAFSVEEASIADIQAAILSHRVTTEQVVRLYLDRIRAYNGACVVEPKGLLGPIATIPDAGQVNALGTLNLRPAARVALGFDAHKARSLTDTADADPARPDALETAAAQDRAFARTGRLVGPLQGVVVAIKDQFDTFDLRTTNGAQVDYADDRPPRDSTVVERLRAAGAIIIAKSNRGSYQGRSAFGGTVCNPYDTTRTPRGSSSGSAVAVSVNLVTCAIGEETGTSIRAPSAASNVIGLAPTQELISRNGMTGPGVSVRHGPICRTAQDTARILQAVVGYDPRDPYSAFSVGRLPERPYVDFAVPGRLDGLRIGVVREFFDPKLYGKRDLAVIGIIDKAVGELKATGATVVDPGAGGALFTECFHRYAPGAFGRLFAARHPDLFPRDAQGKPIGNHVDTLVDLTLHPEKVPDRLTIRDVGQVPATGDSSYWRSLYLARRGDGAVRNERDLNAKTHPIEDPRFWASSPNISTGTPYGTLKGPPPPSYPAELDMADRLYQRFAFQEVVLACLADQKLDAVVYPTMNIPPIRIQSPEEPELNGRGQAHWVIFGQQGFPAITVPAGFTGEVYDREPDPSSPDGTKLVGPVPAHLPVGIDFAARPFAEPLLLRIAAAYQAVANHREVAMGYSGLPRR
jgi:amidase